MIRLKVDKSLGIYGAGKTLRNKIKAMFTVDNPVYIDNIRMSRSNVGVPRKIKAFKAGKKRLAVPVGAVDDVIELIKGDNEKYSMTDNSLVFPVRPAFKFEAKLRPLQKPAVKEMLKHDKGLLQASTGAGKTVMALHIIYKRQQKTIIIVHTSSLADQWVERIMSFMDIKEVEIGRIGGSKFRIGRRITVALVQSLYTCAEELRGIFGLVVVDECHRAPGRTFTDAMEFMNAKYRLGLSATPYRNDGLDMLIFWYIGPLRYEIEKKKLLDNGDILEPHFIMRETEFYTEKTGAWDYVYLLQELCEDEERNRLICNDIANEHTTTPDLLLVLSDRVTHCEEIVRILTEEHQIIPLLLTGDVPPGQARQHIIHQIGKTARVIVATGPLIGEGFDCKELNQMFMTTPMKFKGRVTQYIGRVMRPAPGKLQPTVWDYVDWEITVLASSARERMKVYGGKDVIEFR